MEKITHTKAVELSQYMTIADISEAKELFEHFFKGKSKEEIDTYSLFVFAVGCVYNAGKINGIRIERAKRSKTNEKNSQSNYSM